MFNVVLDYVHTLHNILHILQNQEPKEYMILMYHAQKKSTDKKTFQTNQGIYYT